MPQRKSGKNVGKKKTAPDGYSVVCALCGQIIKVLPKGAKEQVPIYGICQNCKRSRPVLESRGDQGLRSFAGSTICGINKPQNRRRESAKTRQK